ncbi:hypothetical protein [Streptomyces xanthochromogenes]|uniref:Uncharacterized protein n=2 Tax=Streptomyces TaxID=1883 RepID=A0ABQ2ZZ46_9ACTN|nr:hypothetical protein [Streptomyces xanthochromogenes]GGY28089.1 hypothetical protein GCM10010326_22080 [Streptomyces xanthochromogenes]
MIPAAARAVIAAHLTDELDVQPHLATAVVAALADRLATDGWHVTDSYPARPVAPRAREIPRARRSLARLLGRARTTERNTP